MAHQLLLPLKAVQARIPYSKVHIYRLMRYGKFPKAVKIGENRVAWLEEEIEQWVTDRIRERDETLIN